MTVLTQVSVWTVWPRIHVAVRHNTVVYTARMVGLLSEPGLTTAPPLTHVNTQVSVWTGWPRIHVAVRHNTVVYTARMVGLLSEPR